MLHIYLIKAPSHTSASKLKEEKWAMDGFVSILLLQKDFLDVKNSMISIIQKKSLSDISNGIFLARLIY